MADRFDVSIGYGSVLIRFPNTVDQLTREERLAIVHAAEDALPLRIGTGMRLPPDTVEDDRE